MFSSPSVRTKRRAAAAAAAAAPPHAAPASGGQETSPHKRHAPEPQPSWLPPLAKRAPKPSEFAQNAGSAPAQNTDSAPAQSTDAATAQHTLLRGDRHAVFEVAGLPPAARQLLDAADVAGAGVACGVSDELRFAFAATTATCLVWALDGAAAVYRLAMPDAASAAPADAPAVALVPGADLRGDVGLVACSSSGHVRYWERVVFGLGGAEQFRSAELLLPTPDDRCLQLAEVCAGVFVAATSSGCLFRLALLDAQGAATLDARALSRTAGSRVGMLSRMASLLGAAASADAGAADELVAVARGARTEIRHSREVFALTRTRLAKWVVSRAHAERLVYTADLHRTLADAVASASSEDTAFTVYDVAARGGDVCLLLGLHASQDAPTRLAVAVLRGDHVSAEPAVAALELLCHSAPPHPPLAGPTRPRLVLPAAGPGLFVVLGQTVVAAAMPGAAAAFEEAVSLRSGDCVLGAAAARQSPHESGECSVLLACRRAGVLRMVAAVRLSLLESSADLDADAESGAGWPQPGARAGRLDSSSGSGSGSGKERRLQEQIEQAVFFGSDGSRNPLDFAIASDAPGTDTHLQAAALRVSQSIVDGTSRFVPDRLDIGALLRERLRHAHSVMQVLADNGLSAKLTLSARTRLSANAEKLAAVTALWELQNAAWARTGAALQLLSNLAAAFVEGAGQQSRDPLRLFFRNHTSAIGDLLALMHRRLPALTRALAVSASGIHDSNLVSYEASRIAIALLQPAFAYRFQHAHLYACSDGAASSDALPERWTENPMITDLLIDRLGAAYSLCRDLSGRHCAPIYERICATALPGDDSPEGAGSTLAIFDDAVSASRARPAPESEDDDQLQRLDSDDPYASPRALLRESIDQVGPLANLCFRVFVDRIARLDTSNPSSAQVLSQRYDAVRTRHLLCLVPLGRAPAAFRLAEEYRDLASLVTLVFVADSASAASHLRHYVERFGKEFADTLLAFYERRSAWASLLYTQDEFFDSWLKEYIDCRIADDPHGPLSQVGWIHDVKMADFGAAAAKLTRAGCDAEEVNQARTMLSLSKLAFVAVEAQESVLDDTMTEAYSRLEDALELCEVQAHFLHYYSALLRHHSATTAASASAGQTWRRRDDANDRKAAYDAAVLTTTPELRHSCPAQYIVYSELVRRLWNGRSLSVEDLLDALTFPDSLYPVELVNESERDEPDEQSNAVVRERFSLAVDVLCRASFSLPELTREAALRTIWRRVFLSDDWPAIRRRATGNVPDSVLRAELAATNLYHVLRSCWTMRELAHPDWYLLPSDVSVSADIEYLVSTRLMPQFGQTDPSNDASSSSSASASQWKPLTATTAQALTQDYIAEDKRLQVAIDSGLDEFYAEILRTVIDQATTSASISGHSDDMLPSSSASEVDSAASSGESDEQMDTD